MASYRLINSTGANEVLRLDAFAPTLPTQPFDIITAELSNGSLGRSEFVVQYPAGADMGLPVTLHPSVPYPLRAGSSAILGVAVANGGANATIRHVDFLLPGGFDMRHNGGRGAELFAAGGAPEKVSGTGSGGAWSRVDGRHIRWTGTQAVAAGKAAEFLVSVNITSDLSQATGLEGAWTPRIATELEYDNAYTLTSTGWGQTPGFVRSLVKPDSLLTPEADGYPHAPQEPGQIVTYPVRAEVHMPMGKLTAESEYTLVSGTSELGRVRNAADNATMRVSERIAPMGSIVSVDHDVSSLLTTLADEGAGAITLKTELYTPASEACGPTRTWSRTASTLPLATIDDIELYDELGLGAPGVYLASRDGQAYKVGTLGATAWSRATQGVPTVVAAATMPVVGASVFVGTADGAVARVDPLLGGSVAWSVAMTTTGDPTGDPTIRGILPNATSGKLLVWSDKVIEILDPATGARVATRDYGVPVNTNTIRQVAWDADGAITFLDQHGLYRIDGALATLDGLFVEDAVGFALTPTSALLALPESVSILDRPTLSQAGDALPLAGAAKLAAAGDATGDGIDDLVVALDTLVVQVVSGATNTITATRTAALPDLGLGVGGIPAYGPRYVPDGDSVVLDQMTMDTMDCPETSITNAYDADQACFDTQDPNNRVPLPLRLDARDGYVLYSFRLSSVAKTVAWDADGDLVLAVQHAPGIMPTSQTMGAWTAGTDAFAVATSDGTLSLYAASTGALVWSAQPTSSTGTFAFHLRVPQGGFFGTHMLLTRIQWEDPAAGPQEAVLTDWFQVVGPDGTPVLTPYYTMVALLQADDRPLLAEP